MCPNRTFSVAKAVRIALPYDTAIPRDIICRTFYCVNFLGEEIGVILIMHSRSLHKDETSVGIH